MNTCSAFISILIKITDLKKSTITINSKSGIEGLSECGVDSVEEGHCVRDAVEGQNSCTVIHIHSYSGGAGVHREFRLFIIVFESGTGAEADQTPGLIIRAKSTLITFPADVFIRHCNINTSHAKLDLPVTASSQTFTTENLRHSIKSLWMIRMGLDLIHQCHFSVPLRQSEISAYCVWIQSELTGI